MAADSTAYDAVLKEIWTSDNLESQIYQDNPLLAEIEKTQRYNVGDHAVTPLHVERSGGYTVVPRTGSDSLNSADPQGLNQATWNYTHHWFQIQVETATVDETANKSLAVASVVDTEVSGAVNDLRKQITRQAFSAGDGLIAKCGTTTSSTTVALGSTDYGYDAIVRGWLYPGLKVDIGTTSNPTSVASGRTITAVTEDSASPSITIDGAAVTTSSSHYISITGSRSGSTSYEMNGLRNIVSESAVLGGLDPASVPQWKAADVDNTSQALALALLYEKQRQVMQRTGVAPDWNVTSLKQQEAFYKLLQQQARFDGDKSLGTGNVQNAHFAGMTIYGQPDCPDKSWFFLTKKHLFIVATDQPHWHNKYTGTPRIFNWTAGSTRLVAGLVYRIQLATNRRNAHAALTNLS